MTKINAKIVADSIDVRGNRLTSYILTYPRFIHGELMTHRMFSRSSASSRAIPFEKMLKMAEENPFIPIAWQKDHKGMQGVEYFTNKDLIRLDIGSEWGGGATAQFQADELLNSEWKEICKSTIKEAKRLNSLGVTKQLCNRLLEPFMWHTVLVTATEYDNFFELRSPKYQTPVSQTCEPQRSWKDLLDIHSNPINEDLIENNKDNWTFKMQLSKSGADIHIQALAEAMWDAKNESTPKKLQPGEWHIPFGDKINAENFVNANAHTLYNNGKGIKANAEELRIQVAVARCARLSYATFDGEINYTKDLELFNILHKNKHMSPFEHIARCMTDLEYYSFVKGEYPTTQDDYGIVNYEIYPYTIKAMFEGEKDAVGVNPYNGDLYGWCNNFKGFIPYRYIIENEK